MTGRLSLFAFTFVSAVVSVFCAASFPALAERPAETVEQKIAAFREVTDIPVLEGPVPRVLEIPYDALPFTRAQMAVFDEKARVFLPHLAATPAETAVYLPPPAVSVVQGVTPNAKKRGDFSALSDVDFLTDVDFDLPEDAAGDVALEFLFSQPVTADTLRLALQPHVAMPENIELRAEVGGQMVIVRALDKKQKDGGGVISRGICGTCVQFPSTTAQRWQLRIKYGQPLRVAEIFFQAGLRDSRQQGEASPRRHIRFLAQPGGTYRVFRDPDRDVSIFTTEGGDLSDDKGVLRLDTAVFQPNALYAPSDTDKDGVIDVNDNCVLVNNPGQEDVNNNRRGDACDDFDRDSVSNADDNCPNHPNRDQRDNDGDGVGDACDGEESRLTEKHAFLPWLALAAVGGLLLLFFVRVARQPPPEQ